MSPGPELWAKGPLKGWAKSSALFHSMILPFPLYCSSLSSLSSIVLPFPLYCSSLSSLSSMVPPFPLYSSSFSSIISSPCRPHTHLPAQDQPKQAANLPKNWPRQAQDLPKTCPRPCSIGPTGLTQLSRWLGCAGWLEGWFFWAGWLGRAVWLRLHRTK